MAEDRKWINDVELADVGVKWAFSHFDGREDTYNNEGDHNFTLILPEKDAKDLAAEGWAIKENPPYEEGDDPEFTLKVRLSYRYDKTPKYFLIKGDRKFRADPKDLADIKRSTAERIDVIITPSFWANNGRSGVTAYAKELYATVKQSRFAQDYADLEEV